ncbi:MAG: 4Fe-4S dicluster domain-containing protein [Deltaproteobacteria bacterium]|nr:4Fe-4S dicluster domain-containing protein [Deltaproteobacteria bacterium]MBW2660626.1 4Fe-4S dicluster domain-containing protein [Deltaproteobacteria bacterium]
MIKRSFIGLLKPRLEYESLGDTPSLKQIPASKEITLLSNCPFDKKSLLLKKKAIVKTGQKLLLYKESDEYVVSSVTGQVSSISSYTGDFGRSYTAIAIEVADDEEIDDEFKSAADGSKNAALETVKNYLAFAPGNPPVEQFSNKDKPINTIVVCCTDNDLLITTNQYVIKSDIDGIKNGISILKTATGVNDIIMVASKSQMPKLSAIGEKVKQINDTYPSALPHLIMKDILGKVAPAGKNPEDVGVCFISAEAVASIGNAFNNGQIPVTKILTLVKKDGSKLLVSARIGTPVSDIFNSFNITLNENDRIIFGGPMTGSCVYSGDHPVQPDTDAIIVQDKDDIPVISDYPCTNCGDCIRVCPANIQINLLVRFLEAGQYEEAADQYDLHSCIECGLCSYVCVSQMPIFQYIKAAKYELDRANTAEGTNG